MNLSKPFLINVCINLRRCDIHVPEHLLDASKIRSSCQKMRCEAVPQCMRSQIPWHPCLHRVFLYQSPYFNTTHRPACSRKQQEIVTQRFGQPRPELRQVLNRRFYSNFADRNDTLSVAFAETSQGADIKI